MFSFLQIKEDDIIVCFRKWENTMFLFSFSLSFDQEHELWFLWLRFQDGSNNVSLKKMSKFGKESLLILMIMKAKGGDLWRDQEKTDDWTGKFFDFCCNIFANAYSCLTNEIVMPLKAFWDNCVIFWEVLETALLGNDNWESDNFW